MEMVVLNRIFGLLEVETKAPKKEDLSGIKHLAGLLF
jgi:hypothetical protein